MYTEGIAEQLGHARERFLRIIDEHKPEKVLVFTTKGWLAVPEDTVEGVKPLIEGQKVPDWGTYMVGDHRVLVCGFRPPQGADSNEMKKQVRTFLELRTETHP